MLQGDKNCKLDKKFIIRDTAQYMAKHTEKQVVYLRQKQGRNTPPERKGMSILSNEEECSSQS